MKNKIKYQNLAKDIIIQLNFGTFSIIKIISENKTTKGLGIS